MRVNSRVLLSFACLSLLAIPSFGFAEDEDSTQLENALPTPMEDAPPLPMADANIDVLPAIQTEYVPTQSEIADARSHRGHPYAYTKPTWGIQLSASLSALGGTNITGQSVLLPGDQNPVTVEAPQELSLYVEYQPKFFQNLGIGVLGLGPSLAEYLYTSAHQVQYAGSGLPVWSYGAQIHYQALFFHEQILVPTVGYLAEQLIYAFPTGQGSVLAQGPSLGLMLLLNALDPSHALDGYVQGGVARSYFVGEARMMSGSDGTVTFSGASYYFGLRIEL